MTTDETTKLKTVYRVKLRLASFSADGLVWQRLVVDRPSPEEASELIKWAHRLDGENKLTRPFDQNCTVEKRKAPADRAMPPLQHVLASLEASFTLRKP
jgi:hypothetical protein